MTTVHGERATGWTVDDGTFGARLALVRQRMDWNIKEAARECGLPAASWRTWERDGVSPRRIVEIAALIAARTGCDFGWLLEPKRLTGAVRTAGDAATDRLLTRNQPTPAAIRLTPIVSATLPDRPNAANNRPPSGPRRVSTRPGNHRPAILPRPAAA